MKKKLFSRKGMTLAEMLIAVAILALFVSMAIVGTSGLFGTAEDMSVISKAGVLGSDVMQIVTNEIRYGEGYPEKPVTDQEKLTFDSSSYGNGCEMYSEGGKLVITKTVTTADADGNTTEQTTTFEPLGSAAYDEVQISKLTFSVTNDGAGKTTVTVEVSITGSGRELWNQKVNIVPLVCKL